VLIRDLNYNEITELAELAKKTYAETFGDSMSSEDLAIEFEVNRFEKYFKSVFNVDTILVAIISSKIAGYIQLSDAKVNIKNGPKPTNKDKAVNALYVGADYQSKGVGRSLMDAAFTHNYLQHAKNIYIDVWDKNTKALNFYKKYGFKVVGICDVIVNGKCVDEDLVLMRPFNLQG